MNQAVIQIGISIENLESVHNLGLDDSGLLERKEFAHKIALDLYNYMLSFSPENPSQTSMVVSKNVFDSWLSRFEAKYKRDPNFMMKME